MVFSFDLAGAWLIDSLAGIALDNSAHVPIQSTCNVTVEKGDI